MGDVALALSEWAKHQQACGACILADVPKDDCSSGTAIYSLEAMTVLLRGDVGAREDRIKALEQRLVELDQQASGATSAAVQSDISRAEVVRELDELREDLATSRAAEKGLFEQLEKVPEQYAAGRASRLQGYSMPRIYTAAYALGWRNEDEAIKLRQRGGARRRPLLKRVRRLIDVAGELAATARKALRDAMEERDHGR